MRASLLKLICLCFAVVALIGEVAHAGDRVTLGFGRLLTNDLLGDGKDRWRTGSYVHSQIRGYEWDGARPDTFGELLEFRLRGEVFAPQNLHNPVAGDRPFAGAISVGVHTHWRRKNTEFSLGADLVITGKQTGLGTLQRNFHNLLGVSAPSNLMLANQIGNGFHPTLSFEMGQVMPLSNTIMLRPFIEARAGDETLARIGADIIIGAVGQSDLLLRDVTTGQFYRGIKSDAHGMSFILGGDIAKVESSIYLPASGGYVLTDTRSRLRAGVHWQGENRSLFYGATWLSEEFQAQSEGQIVGSVHFGLQF